MIYILFVHLPKCGGLYINNSLKNVENIKYKWYVHRILKYDINLYDNYFKFTAVRNPYEKLASLYFYMTNSIKKRNLKTDKDKWPNIINNLFEKYKIVDIKSFLNNYKEFYNIEIKPLIENIEYINKTQDMCYHYGAGFFPQTLFICDENDNILVDKIINISNINNYLLEKFNINSTVKINTHSHTGTDYKQFYSKKNFIDIYKIYEKDFKILGKFF